MGVDFASASSERIDTSAVPMSDTTTLTLMCWAMSDTASQNGAMVGFGTNSSFGGYELDQSAQDSASAGDYWSIHVPGINIQSSDSTITQDIWYHVCATRGATTWNLYVDGVAQTISMTSNPNAAPDRCSIGAQPESGSRTRHFDGKVCEVRAWNIELTAAQINIEMRSKRPRMALSNLELWMPLDNSSVPGTYTDYSPSAVTGSPINTPTAYDHTHF